MNVLVLGKGGREHALGRGLLNSASVDKVFALPGSHGMEPQITCFIDSAAEASVIQELCVQHKINLVVIGPEDPLVAGLGDELRKQGLIVFGPGQSGAALEGSKVRSKEFMADHAIPTAHYIKVVSVADVKEQMENFTPPYVLKADGLAAGKGVFICKTADELLEASSRLFNDRILGAAGDQAILEQFQPGFELSFFVLTNGSEYVAMPMAQDHKRLQDGDQGPNTGGMGTVAPMKISDSLYSQIIKQVVEPTVKGLDVDQLDYRGVLFIGIMVTDQGPQVLEYNVRFGDPETQVLIPLLDGDWGQAFMEIGEGRIPKLQWKSGAAACVVIAAENYPDTPKKGVPIESDFKETDEQYLLHAGTLKKQDQWVTNGGRVLNSIGLGESIPEALKRAYAQVDTVSWPKMQYRKDIGKNSQVL